MQQNEIRLRFQNASELEREEAIRGVGQKVLEPFVTAIEDIESWFTRFHIESIELWISGGAKTGNVLELFVSAKGEGGLKVVLKPKPEQQ